MRVFHQQYVEEQGPDIANSCPSLSRLDASVLFEEHKNKHDIIDKYELFYLFEKTPQAARAEVDEFIGLECVQAYISNMSTFSSLEELEWFEGFTLPENIMYYSENEWTAPKWAKAGDIVFFMHSKTARSTLTRLRSILIQEKNSRSIDNYQLLMSYLDHALEIHSQYGGKIFAVGRVCGAPEKVESEDRIDEFLHWKSRNYAVIDNICILKNPLDISLFREYISISPGSSITPLFEDEFNQLRENLQIQNSLPDYVKNSIARPVPLRKINDKNWLKVANSYRRCFILEKQFRKFYVDYFLRSIGDRKKFYTECRCTRSDIHDSFMDYVFLFDGKYLPVETKLSVTAENNIVGQVGKYVYNEHVFLDAGGKGTVSGKQFHCFLQALFVVCCKNFL